MEVERPAQDHRERQPRLDHHFPALGPLTLHRWVRLGMGGGTSSRDARLVLPSFPGSTQSYLRVSEESKHPQPSSEPTPPRSSSGWNALPYTIYRMQLSG